MLEYKKENSELIVMLTHNDCTVENAYRIFDRCKDSKAKFWGLKEKGLSFEQMKKLYAYMKECGKTTALEVVAYTEDECMAGANMAVECGCDFLMGTMFFNSVNEYCKQKGLKYMPLVGKVSGRPSILEGDMDKMIDEANEYIKKGVFGFVLLAYRYLGDSASLIRKFMAQVNAPICVAGGIDNYNKLDEIKNSAPWAFTIGGAFFENRFGETHEEQIDRVFEYIDT